MSRLEQIRSRNAGDFSEKYRQIRYNYEGFYRKEIAKVRAEYARSLDSFVDESLEAHYREYFVNAFLRALNWRLEIDASEGLPNLIPESPVVSASSGTIRRLDYFGIEQQTFAPLLIVETKRPQVPLPIAMSSSNRISSRELPPDSYPSVIAAGLRGEPLTGKWNKWLKDMREYVKSVHQQSGHPPKRVVLINGQWLILFADPADSFLDDGSRNANRIFVYVFKRDEEGNQLDEIAERRNEIFELLEYQQVIGKDLTLTVRGINFHLTSDSVAHAMHGLRVLYIVKPEMNYLTSPIIELVPVVFLCSKQGAWIRVESGEGNSIPLPHDYTQLNEHLQLVDHAAEELLGRINETLEISLKPFLLGKHYQDENFFESLKGVTYLRGDKHYDEYLVVTGKYTHYLKRGPSKTNCSHHNWKSSEQQGCAEPKLHSIQRRSTEPRSFFISEEKHHCTHSDVSSVKAKPITPQNRERCGARSGKDFDAFCEIWSFEKHLCCRACVFEEICTKAKLFNLPCLGKE